jgi:hypothetical protein
MNDPGVSAKLQASPNPAAAFSWRQVFSFAGFLGALLVAAPRLAAPKIPCTILPYSLRGRARCALASLAGMEESVWQQDVCAVRAWPGLRWESQVSDPDSDDLSS